MLLGEKEKGRGKGPFPPLLHTITAAYLHRRKQRKTTEALHRLLLCRRRQEPRALPATPAVNGMGISASFHRRFAESLRHGGAIAVRRTAGGGELLPPPPLLPNAAALRRRKRPRPPGVVVVGRTEEDDGEVWADDCLSMDMRLAPGAGMAEGRITGPPVAPPARGGPAKAKMPETCNLDRNNDREENLDADHPVTVQNEDLRDSENLAPVKATENGGEQEEQKSAPKPIMEADCENRSEEGDRIKNPPSEIDGAKSVESIKYEAALEMLLEVVHLKSEMLDEEFEEMCGEIREFARKMSKEQKKCEEKARENPEWTGWIDKTKRSEILKEGIRAIADRFVKNSKINNGARKDEADHSEKGNQDDNGEDSQSESSDWQEGFSAEMLEEMKGLCAVYAAAKGGLKSKEQTDQMMMEIIKEMKRKGLECLKGKAMCEEAAEAHLEKGATTAPEQENLEGENNNCMAGKNSDNLNSEYESGNGRGIPHVCDIASKNDESEKLVSRGTKNIGEMINEKKENKNEVRFADQTKGNEGGAPGMGRGRNYVSGNNGSNVAWGNKQGNQKINDAGLERGRSQVKEGKRGPQSRSNSRNQKGKQEALRGQVPNSYQQGKGPTAQQNQMMNEKKQWNNAPSTMSRNNYKGFASPGRNFEKGEGSRVIQNEGGGRYNRGRGRGYYGRGGRGGFGGFGNAQYDEKIKEYEREAWRMSHGMQVWRLEVCEAYGCCSAYDRLAAGWADDCLWEQIRHEACLLSLIVLLSVLICRREEHEACSPVEWLRIVHLMDMRQCMLTKAVDRRGCGCFWDCCCLKYGSGSMDFWQLKEQNGRGCGQLQHGVSERQEG
nr:hypothetical protein Iba_chr12cCG23780 [Ipomoea batatas]